MIGKVDYHLLDNLNNFKSSKENEDINLYDLKFLNEI